MDVKWQLIDLICISVMTSDVEHLFTCVLAICTSLKKYLVRYFAHFLRTVVCFLYVFMAEDSLTFQTSLTGSWSSGVCEPYFAKTTDPVCSKKFSWSSLVA